MALSKGCGETAEGAQRTAQQNDGRKTPLMTTQHMTDKLHTISDMVSAAAACLSLRAADADHVYGIIDETTLNF